MNNEQMLNKEVNVKTNDDIKMYPSYDGDEDGAWAIWFIEPVTEKGKAALDQLVKEEMATVDNGTYNINWHDFDAGLYFLADESIKLSGVYDDHKFDKIHLFSNGTGMSEYGIPYGEYREILDAFYKK